MADLYGNKNGIRQTLLVPLEALYDLEIENNEFCNDQLIDTLAAFTHATGREAMVYIERGGTILAVAIGDNDRVNLPTIRARRSLERLSGIRCIHTHPSANGRLSEVDIQSLKKLRMDAMAAVGVDRTGQTTNMYIGILNERTEDGDYTVNVTGPYSPHKLPHRGLLAEIRAADNRIRPPVTRSTAREKQRAITVGIDPAASDYDPLQELAQLCDTAGYDVMQAVRQSRDKPDGATYIGHGKLRELALLVQAWDADVVVFDDELSPAQIRNLETSLGQARILDRTSLILEIFAQRASTHEGRLQVSLAQMRYMLPRLTGWGAMMSRLGGGGGGGMGARRGAGEMQIELDRRRLRERIHATQAELDTIVQQRERRRAARERRGAPVVALVGYTNAGKSTLLNRLSGSDVLAEDKLFATLDTTSRQIDNNAGAFMLIDTVGFINKLPHELVRAFRATLEEVVQADALIHVVDATAPGRLQQMQVVKEVLAGLGAGDKPTVVAYNKIDRLDQPPAEGQDVNLSAQTGQGIDQLFEAVKAALSNLRQPIAVVLPQGDAGLLSQAYAQGEVLNCEYKEDGIHLTAIVPDALAGRLQAHDLYYQPPEEEPW